MPDRAGLPGVRAAAVPGVPEALVHQRVGGGAGPAGVLPASGRRAGQPVQVPGHRPHAEQHVQGARRQRGPARGSVPGVPGVHDDSGRRAAPDRVHVEGAAVASRGQYAHG